MSVYEDIMSAGGNADGEGAENSGPEMDTNLFSVYVYADVGSLTSKSQKIDAKYIFQYPDGRTVTTDGNIKLQGAGSMRWAPHYNFTINKLGEKLSFVTYDGTEAVPHPYENAKTRIWGARKKFVLKADHMDHTHGRNIIGARIWGDMVSTRNETLLGLTSQPDDWAVNYDKYYRFSAHTETYRLNASSTFIPIYVYYTTTDNGQEPITGGYYPLVEKPDDWETNYGDYYFNDLNNGIVQNTHKTFAVYTYKQTDAESPLEKLKTLTNYGAVDGFPCKLYVNENYYGLYCVGIPKDENLLGMDEAENEGFVCGEDWGAGNSFTAEAYHEDPFEFDDGDLAVITEEDYQAYVDDGTTPKKAWVIEYNEDDPNWIPSSLDELLQVVRDYETYPDGNVFRTALESIFNVESAIDYLLFIRAFGLVDNVARNLILAKYNSSKWFCSVYDMDTAFGIVYLGDVFYSVGDYTEFNENIYTNSTMRLWKRLIVNYHDEIKERYNQLRATGGALSNVNVYDKIIGFFKEIPDTLMVKQGAVYKKMFASSTWPVLPGTGASNMYQIISWYQEHIRLMDEAMDSY